MIQFHNLCDLFIREELYIWLDVLLPFNTIGKVSWGLSHHVFHLRVFRNHCRFMLAARIRRNKSCLYQSIFATDWPSHSGNKLKLVVKWIFFQSVSSICLCHHNILNIPPVCIVATQRLIKCPATNGRQGSDICITKTDPPLFQSNIVAAPHSLLTFPFFCSVLC